MRVALLLLAYAGFVTALAPVLLVRTAWTARAPRLAIWAWQALTVTVPLSVALAGLALAVPTVPVSGNLTETLEMCVMALRAEYAVPGGAAAAASGMALALVVVGRVSWCLSAGLLRARRERSKHARVLSMVGSDRPDLGITVLDDARPAAYCLPGHGHRIVLTSATLTKLQSHELAAVIAHERAHIRQRHHLVLAFAEALQRAFKVALFRTASDETRRLVEMAADDEAIARTSSLTLAAAQVELAGSGTPAASLAASGGQVAHRVRRLLVPREPLRRAVAWGGALAAGAVLALPLVLASQPAVAAVGLSTCPLPDSAVIDGQRLV